MRSGQLEAHFGEVAGLVHDLRQALLRAEELVGARDEAATTELTELVRGTCERLRELSTSLGLENRQAWRLLNLRDALGSRELAASLLTSSDAPVDVVLRVLSRGLHETWAALASGSDQAP